MGRYITNSILGLMALTAIAAALFDVSAGFFKWNVQLSDSYKITLLLLAVGALLLFMFQVRDDSKDAKEKIGLILSTVGTQKVRTFSSRDEWLQLMADEAAKADSVSTQHFSEPPSVLGGKSDEYFRRVNSRIKHNPNHTYRRAASIEGEAKVRWFFETIYDLYESDNFSLGVTSTSHRDLPLNCFEISRIGSSYSTFVFSSVPLTGAISAFLVKDEEAGRVALASFDEMWHYCRKLKEGRFVNWPEIDKLAKEFNLENSQEYKKLTSKKSEKTA